ncbi:MAG: hypothetical protein GX079_00305 [Tissierellia bacterium]|nr:hypothetical protein [Tissierellia bacterium]
MITLAEPKDDKYYVIEEVDGINFHIELIIWEMNEKLLVTRKGFLGVKYLELVNAKM